MLTAATLQSFRQVPNHKPYTFDPYLFPGCRSSSSLYADNSVSVAASALWRLPLVYLVLNIIRIAAIMGKQHFSNVLAHFSAPFQQIFGKVPPSLQQLQNLPATCPLAKVAFSIRHSTSLWLLQS